MSKVELSISLPLQGCWEVSAAEYDSEVVFPALFRLVPDATELCVEGTSIESEPRALFESHQNPGKYLPQGQVIWSTGQLTQFRCIFSQQLLSSLAAVSARHAEPELLDSLFVYRGHCPLLEWPKALWGPIWISKEISEPKVQAFAQELNAGFKLLQW